MCCWVVRVGRVCLCVGLRMWRLWSGCAGWTWEGVERVRRELMRLWDSSGDEDFVGALREMLEAVVGDLE
jgi:hypothetical protein